MNDEIVVKPMTKTTVSVFFRQQTAGKRIRFDNIFLSFEIFIFVTLQSAKMRILLLIVLFNAGVVFGGSPAMQYNQYKYVGFRNTWHDGVAHEVHFLFKTLPNRFGSLYFTQGPAQWSFLPCQVILHWTKLACLSLSIFSILLYFLQARVERSGKSLQWHPTAALLANIRLRRDEL
jgi:hypothetical protein